MQTAEIKKQLKSAFPQFKFSVTRKYGGYSESLNIVITNWLDIVQTKEQYDAVAPQIKEFVYGLGEENIDREPNGEILMGGNSYVFLDYRDENGNRSSI